MCEMEWVTHRKEGRRKRKKKKNRMVSIGTQKLLFIQCINDEEENLTHISCRTSRSQHHQWFHQPKPKPALGRDTNQ